MSTQLIVPSSEMALPALIERAGKRTLLRFVEFFTVHIPNANTRQAYARALQLFLGWCEQRGVAGIEDIQPLHVAAWRELLKTRGYSVPTVKQHLAAIRELFGWPVEGQVLELNPAGSVKGPRYSISKGLTPVLDGAEARLLLDSIDTLAMWSVCATVAASMTPFALSLRARLTIALPEPRNPSVPGFHAANIGFLIYDPVDPFASATFPA